LKLQNTKKYVLIPILSISLFFLLWQFTPFNTYGSIENTSDAIGFKDQFFVCTFSNSIISCSPSISELEIFQLSLTHTSVAQLFSPDIEYGEGQTGHGLVLIANKRESVEVVNNQSINPARFSISFWAKGNEIPEGLAHVISHVSRPLNSGWLVYSSKDLEGKEFLTFAVTNDEGKLISPSRVEINPDSFTHIVGTFDGKMVQIYRNGKLIDTIDYSESYNSDPGLPLRFGSASFSKSTLRWSGILDEVMLFDKALSNNEIKKIFSYYDSPTNQKELDVFKNFQGEWSFENSLEDSSGNGNDGNMLTLMASMVFAPDGRLFFTEKNTGNIKIIQDGIILEKPFAWVPDLYIDWEQGLLGITLDNDFENNPFVYTYHTAIDRESGKIFNRVVRFTDQNNTGVDMKILMDDIPGTRGYHSGGALAIGPHDEKLYITVGDGTEHIFAQDPNIALGKILRINKNGTIPLDNPFSGSPIFTIGHRNMFGIAFDPNGLGLFTENGEFLYDEINKIEKGGNYGFPTHQPPNRPPELTDPSKSILPLRSYKNAIAPTQMMYYEGDKFPQMKGKFVFSTFVGDIYILTLDKITGKIVKEEILDLKGVPFRPSIAIAQSPEGEIFFGGYNIEKIVSIDFENSTKIGFPISLQLEPQLSANNIKLNIDKKEIIIDFERQQGIDPIENPFIKLKIPKILLNGISLVLNENNRPMNYSLIFGEDDDYNIMIVEYNASNIPKKLIIKGSQVIPEFNFSGNIFFYLLMIGIFLVILLVNRKNLIFSKQALVKSLQLYSVPQNKNGKV